MATRNIRIGGDKTRSREAERVAVPQKDTILAPYDFVRVPMGAIDWDTAGVMWKPEDGMGFADKVSKAKYDDLIAKGYVIKQFECVNGVLIFMFALKS